MPLVLSYAINQRKRVAIATVASAALGDLFMMSASLAGIGALLLASATLFIILKWAGAAYLVYLGIKLLSSASSASLGDLEKMSESSALCVFGHSKAVTALNPISIVLFIVFVPQFIAVDKALLPQLVF